MQIVKVWNPFRFEHTSYDDCFCETGKLVYNCANTVKPIIKKGRAPHDLMPFYKYWFAIEDVIECLVLLGFEKLNDMEWIKND